MILTNSEKLAVKANYITTTAKVLHKLIYTHDMVGYNYPMPKINTALDFD